MKFRVSDSANELKSPLQFCQHFDSENLLKFGSLFFRKRFKFDVSICQIPIFFKLKFQPKLLIWNGISALNPTVSYNRQLRVKVPKFFGLAETLAIPSGFGRSRIRRNCGYTLLATVFFPFFIPKLRVFVQLIPFFLEH